MSDGFVEDDGFEEDGFTEDASPHEILAQSKAKLAQEARGGLNLGATLTGAAHGIASGTGPLSRLVKSTIVRPEALAQNKQDFAEAQKAHPASAEVGDFVGGGFTPEAAVAGEAIGGGLGIAGRALKRTLGKMISRAETKAGEKAAEEVAEKVASARGQYGAEVQKGSRQVENLMRLEPAMTSEQQALYAQLEAAGIVPGLQQQVAGSTLERLPGQASTIAERKAALDALTADVPQAVASRKAELLTPQPRADARSLLKSYAEPLLWAAGTQQLSNALGANPTTQTVLTGAAGIIGGRTRAGKAIKTRLTRPGNQKAMGEFGLRRLEGPTARVLKRTLSRGVPASVEQGREDEE
jgi:hypothetical protein